MLNRLFGVGLAAAVAALTLVLAVTDRLALYISPDGAWFAVAMAFVALAGAVASFALPLGAEGEHGAEDEHGAEGDGIHSPGGARLDASPISENVTKFGGLRRNAPNLAHFSEHDEGQDAGGSHPHTGEPQHAHAHEHAHAPQHVRTHEHPPARPQRAAAVLSLAGGALATVVVATALLAPPAALSAELAMSRDTGAPPLFAGADTVALAATGDTASFGIGEWASVFATTTNPDAFDGTTVTLTGFATPADEGFRLTRLVVTHCVIDAQPASVSVSAAEAPATGEWVTVTGTVRDVGGRLTIDATDVEVVDEPGDPYEF